jgi:glycosyltransferase involved in cell wall biosynthesis
LKILHLIYDHIHNPWVGGGGAVRACEIYRRLAARHDITIVSGKYPGRADFKEGNLSYRFVGTAMNNYMLSTFCYACAASGFVREHGKGADIIIEDFAPYNPLFSPLFLKTPFAIQLHHREGLNLVRRYFLLGLPFAFIERFYPGLFRNVICVSEASKKKFGISGAVVIPNGIDEVSGVFLPEDDYISFVGRLQIHNKGLDTLIVAMALVHARLGIAGKGRDEKKLASRIRDNKLEKRVEFKGFLTDAGKKEFISNSMFMVLPSRYEGQGIVVLEAAACGKPVLVSDIPELKYAVDAGFGLSFKTGDAEDLAGKMKVLLENQSLRQEMGKKAREYAKDFTWDKIAEEYEKYLLSITGKDIE